MQEETGEDIVFSEWTFDNYKVLRKDFTMNQMIEDGKRTQVNEAHLKSKGSILFNLGGIKEQIEELKPVNIYEIVDFKGVYYEEGN